MADPFKFELVSPERVLLSGNAEQVIVPGSEGEFTVLAYHAPIVASMRPGRIRVTMAGEGRDEIFVQSGFAEFANNTLTILTEKAIVCETADPRMLKQELDAAEAALANADDDDTRAHLNRAIEELKVLHAEAA